MKHLTLHDALALEGHFKNTSRIQNKHIQSLDFVPSQDLAPKHHIGAVIICLFTPEGGIIFANHKKRGIEFPGGSVEHNTSEQKSAEDILFQTTKFKPINSLIPFGFERLKIEEQISEKHPIKTTYHFQQFFTAFGKTTETFEETKDYHQPFLTLLLNIFTNSQFPSYRKYLTQTAFNTLVNNEKTAPIKQ